MNPTLATPVLATSNPASSNQNLDRSFDFWISYSLRRLRLMLVSKALA